MLIKNGGEEMVIALPERPQSIVRWTFHPGAGGFVPDDMRLEFKDLGPEQYLEILKELIEPRLPENTRLGAAVHYDKEIDEATAEGFAQKLVDYGIALAMATPGAHAHWANGGIASLDSEERRLANQFAIRAADLMLGPLNVAEDPEFPIAFDVWNGSMGYRYPVSPVWDMVQYADAGMAGVVNHIKSHPNGKNKKIGVEPKGFEKHPAMIYQTTDSVLALRRRLQAMGVDVTNFGDINEFGHTGMQGHDLVQEYVDMALEDAIVHVHANSQGGDDGRLGGPAKHDLDFGVKPTYATLGVAKILKRAEYKGWVEHDFQPGSSDKVGETINRAVAAVCRWEAIMRTIENPRIYNEREIIGYIASGRETELELYLDRAVTYANRVAEKLYRAHAEVPLSRVSFLRDAA